jgi:hypothetical protein
LLSSFPVPLTFSAVDPAEDAIIEVVVDADGDAPDFDSLGDTMDCLASVLATDYPEDRRVETTRSQRPRRWPAPRIDSPSAHPVFTPRPTACC